MKEININIEGYNVNGICVTCLNYNRKMFYNKVVKECLKVLADIDVPDGLSVQVCWECLAKMKYTLKFRTQMLKAYDCLIAYSSKHTFLDSPSDLSSNAVESLSVSVVSLLNTSTSIVEDNEDPIVKEEVEEKVEIEFEMPKLKEEENETHFDDSMPFSPPPIKDRDSSDEDIQLSKLKNVKKKEKKRDRKTKEKKKRETRQKVENQNEEQTPERNVTKRRRLHLELVDAFIMSEEEMWECRERDRQSEQFQAMLYSCSDCLLRLNTKKQLEVHMKGRHRSRPGASQCDVCKGYFAPEHLATHRSLHLSGYRMSIWRVNEEPPKDFLELLYNEEEVEDDTFFDDEDDEDEQASQPSTSRDRSRSPINTSSESCQLCDYSTTMKKLMQIHVSKKHDVVSFLTCTECGSEFNTKSKFNYHKSQCCREKPQCDCCGKVFANKVTLRQHLKPTPTNEKTKDKVFPCGHCDKVFYARKNYKAHIVIHEGVTYPCQICGKLFRWKRNLSRHMRNHRERDSGASHYCRECGKTFASRDCLYNHLRLSKKHVNEKEYLHTCNYCGKKFATKWCMIDHVDWEHLQRIKYQCSVCFKAFKTAKIMVAHMNNTHEGRNKIPDGEHLCEICGKSYKTVKRLKGHVWAMHTTRAQGRTYKCALCPATFTWQTSIYKHVKMMHRNAPQAKQKKEEYPEIRAQFFQQNVLQPIVQTL